MNDIFREVDEEYRQEQLLRLLHANAPRIIVILVIGIALACGYAWWQQNKRTQAQSQTFALTTALEDAHDGEDHHVKPADSRDIMVKAGETLTGGRKVAAQMAAAHYAAAAGDTRGALSLYDSIQAEHEASTTDKALAQLSSLTLRVDTDDPATLSRQLDGLAQDGNPWRFSARELQGLLAMRQGDFTRSKAIFTALSTDADAPQGLRQRAASLAAVTSVPAEVTPSSPVAGKSP